MGKFEIQQAAITFDDGQAVEFALGVAIGERAKMAPINLALHTGVGFKANEGGFGFGVGTHAAEIIPHNGQAAVEAALLKVLANDRCRDLGVDF